MTDRTALTAAPLPTVIHGDCLEQMALMIERGVMVDSIVTDPPAGIAFMGKDWDHHKGGRDQWIAWMQEVAAKAIMLAKPGAHALVWALPRTSHWTVTGWENAGWEVRDRVSHLFGTGFPKSHNISKSIDATLGAKREVIGKYRRPDGTDRNYVDWKINTGEWKDGSGFDPSKRDITAPASASAKEWDGWGTALKPAMEDWWLLRKPLSEPTIAANVLKYGTGGLNIDACRIGGVGGRFPSHLTHDGSDEVLEAFAAFGERKTTGNYVRSTANQTKADGWGHKNPEQQNGYGDTGTAARFFYCAKASKQDRAESRHPTVKPISLMRWLARLITPPNGTILDPFAGSGTTLAAAHMEGFHAVGIEREAEYVDDCRRRIADLTAATKPAPLGGLFADYKDAAE